MAQPSEAQSQGAVPPGGPAAPAGAPGDGDSGRPSTLALAGAGSILAVLAFLGGMAVGHSWDGTSNQQGQFTGPGGGLRGGFPQGTGQGTGQP